MMGKADRSQFWLSAADLVQGEWWRLATFLFDPPACGPICALFGWWPSRLMVLASIGNFLLFFSRDIYINLRYGKRRLVARAARMTGQDDQPSHRCRVCGITDKSHPKMDFRYCPKCAGQCCYCSDHIFSHEHVS